MLIWAIAAGVFCLPYAALSAETGPHPKAETAPSPDSVPAGIRSTFDPGTASWNIDWPGRISQYDLVYLSPPIDPLQGIPLGNGDVGVLFWCED